MAIESHPIDLYARIVGAESWSELGEAVRRLHYTTRGVRLSGAFKITHGNNIFARSLVRLLGFPRAGADVHTELIVTSNDNGEIWQRSFAGRGLISRQFEHTGPLLRERIRIMDFFFSLEVKDKTLFYRQIKSTFGFGKLNIPLPRWLAPRIVATEKSTSDESGVLTSVQIISPILGLLISYEGCVKAMGSSE